MNPLNIVTGSSAPVLRATAKPIVEFTASINTLAKKMIVAMQKAKGVGIAAPQVDVSLQMFVIAKEAFNLNQSGWRVLRGVPLNTAEPLTVLNPKIITKPDANGLEEEGCLSLPKVYGLVARSKKVVLTAQTLTGESFKLQARGFLARVIQHEYDHLRGVLICDRFIPRP